MLPQAILHSCLPPHRRVSSSTTCHSPSTGNSVSLHRNLNFPAQTFTPRIAKIKKKKKVMKSTLANYEIDSSNVETKSFKLGKAESERSGLKSLKVLITETLLKPGRKLRQPVSTTMKSNQFQASRRYEHCSHIKPIASILSMASAMKTAKKTGSKLSIY